MNEFKDNNKSLSEDIREKIDQALKSNDTETLCYIISEELTNNLNEEDALFLINHDVNLFERVFIGILDFQEYNFIIEMFNDIFEFFEKFSPEVVRKRTIEAYFSIRPQYHKKERFSLHFEVWFFDYFIENNRSKFSSTLKNILIDILIRKDKEKLVDFITEYFIDIINREDFITVLQDTDLNYLGFLFSILKDYESSWYGEEYYLIPADIFRDPPQIIRDQVTEFMESSDLEKLVILINSDFIKLIDSKKLLRSMKVNIFFTISEFFKDNDWYMKIRDGLWDWALTFLKNCKNEAPNDYSKKFEEFLRDCSLEELLRILRESTPFPLEQEELPRIIQSSDSDYLEKFISIIPLIQEYYEEPLYIQDWLSDWFYQTFTFVKNDKILNEKLLLLCDNFLPEIINTRWVEHLNDGNFISLMSDSKKELLNLLNERLLKFSKEGDKFKIASIVSVLDRFLLLQKERFDPFIKQLPQEIYDKFIEACKSILIASTTEYRHQPIDKVIKQSCAILIQYLEDYNILDEYQFVTFKHEFFLVIDQSLTIKNREITNISQIEGLQDLKQLKALDLSWNKIEALSNLESLDSLEILNLSHNNIRNLNGLQGLLSLRNLDLSFNSELFEITRLETFKNLTRINLNRTKLPIQLQVEHNAKKFIKNYKEFMKKKKFSEAKEVFNETKVLINEKKFQESKVLLIKVLELYPLLYEAWNELGFVLLELKEFDEAEKWLKNVIHCNDCVYLHHRAYYLYAQLLSLKNDNQEALINLQNAIKIVPEYRFHAKGDPAFISIREYPEFKNMLLGFTADKEEQFPPSSIGILDTTRYEVYNIARKGYGTLRKKKGKKGVLELPNPSQLQLLEELERNINKQLPYVYTIEYGTSGVRVEEGNITGLALIACDISILPEVITQLEFLTELVIRDEKLSSIPKTINKLLNLTSLTLSGFAVASQLRELPDSIIELDALENLTLESNQLNELPQRFGRLKNLRKLNLWDNNLQALPDSIGDLLKLKELLMGLNKDLKRIPNTLKNLRSLETLSFHQNNLNQLPECIAELRNLHELDLSSNSLKFIPDSIQSMVKLKELDLSANYMGDFPEIITTLTGIERLDLSGNYLQTIPKSIGKLVNLRRLHLDYNRELESLPDSIANLKSLEYLGLTECYDTVLPNSLKSLKKLQVYGNSDIDYEPDGSFNLTLSTDWGVPSVVGYEDEDERNQLKNPTEIIIEEESIIIEFTYPLSREVELEFNNKGGFSRMDLWRYIYEGYKKIYDEEESDAGDPGNAPNLLNRAQSNGRYGIWGHYLGELYIERISYDANTKRVSMFIGS